MAGVIKKIEKVTASEQVFQSLRGNIAAHMWKENEKLPSETELASLYGVNRLTVRTALQRLNALGLVETRIGDGTYIKKFEFADYIRAAQDLVSDPKLMDDVCEFRKHIEKECARLAIFRATPEEFYQLKEICDEYDSFKKNLQFPIKDESLKEMAHRDCNFHAKICSMSHNTFYSYCFTMARPTIEKYITLNLKNRLETWEKRGVSPLEGDFRHRGILEAMEQKNFDLCEKLYDDMIDFNIEL